jgi:hypothetical protein
LFGSGVQQALPVAAGVEDALYLYGFLLFVD